ncbi:hypothetical protein [Cedecea colo]|uniref:p-hydroxybenzoic acid efflux pump subunit AaeA-like beta-barrel domain-containing protein n=1 Tax=Cedecea colo TaxID=2552946 RepID=A0ABX0VSD7_9ENTR|nr:hypothetical protein [Cedecea colo]NIY49252.1 hypothetical protein [Cedecea colo]
MSKNFALRSGAYAIAGQPLMALANNSGCYIAGYFEETRQIHIKNGDKVINYIMSNNRPLSGHFDGLSAGINDSERATEAGNLPANVNPTCSVFRHE